MQFHKFARCARASTSPYILNTELITMNDVIIIGGSFAGLAAALQLGRARRKVTVLDTGRQRNRFAARSHGVLGHDHKPPQDIWPRRGSNWHATQRSSSSTLAPKAYLAPSTISASSRTITKACGRAA